VRNYTAWYFAYPLDRAELAMVRPLALLRAVCVKIGLEIAPRDYDFSSPQVVAVVRARRYWVGIVKYAQVVLLPDAMPLIYVPSYISIYQNFQAMDMLALSPVCMPSGSCSSTSAS
jgi:hypothetical protein